MGDDVRIEAMAFYHGDGFVPAFSSAQAFAGDGGRIATIPDILESRIRTNARTAAWTNYFTTISSEFYGRSAGGVPIVVVAHGIGPLATREGILEAYRHEYRDRERNRNNSGGRIPGEQFRRLENGDFGDVHVVDIAASMGRYQFPYSARSVEELLSDPFWLARMGGADLAERYLQRHQQVARDEDFKPGNRPIRMGQHLNGDGSYSHPNYRKEPTGTVWYEELKEVEDGFARANLMSIGSLVDSHSDGREDLQGDIGLHSWYDGTRIAAYREGAPVGAKIHYGVERNMTSRQLMAVASHVPKDAEVEGGLEVLVQSADYEWFVQHPKRGQDMDTGSPKHRVDIVETIRKGVVMEVEMPSPFFFRYGIDAVRRVAPDGANAYAIASEVRVKGDRAAVDLDFYRVEVDRRLTIPTYDEITRSYDLTMKAIEAR